MKRLLFLMISIVCMVSCTKQLEDPIMVPALPEGSLGEQPYTKADGISIYIYQHEGNTLFFGGEIENGEMGRYTEFFDEPKLISISNDVIITDKGTFSFNDFQIEGGMIEDQAEIISIEASIDGGKI